LGAYELLDRCLPENGGIIVVALKGTKRQQKWCNDLELAVEAAFRFDALGYDAYFCISTFIDAHHEHPRSHANFWRSRDLIADIDTRESKPNAHYANAQEAETAVRAFCSLVAIPLPVFVHSGGGLHLHWPLVEELDFRTWRQLAFAFKRCCDRAGLHVDPSRATDLSSILRVPGTHHWRLGRKVEIIGGLVERIPSATFSKIVEEFSHDTDPVDRNNHPDLAPAGLQGTREQLRAAVATVYGNEPSDLERVRRACRQVAAFVEGRGTLGNDHWHNFIGLAAYAEPDGLQYIQNCAAGYRGFARDDTDNWCAQKAARTLAETKGPTTCETFEQFNPGGCDGCLFKGKITTPLQLGRGVDYFEPPQAPQFQASPSLGGTTSTPSADQAQFVNGYGYLPQLGLEDYHLDQRTGQLQFITSNAKTHQQECVVVSDQPIYVDRAARGERSGLHHLVFRFYQPGAGWQTCPVVAGEMLGQPGLVRLANAGAHIRLPDQFRPFVRDSVDALRRRGTGLIAMIYEQNGWKDEQTAFLIGRSLFTKHGIEIVEISEGLEKLSQWLGPRESGNVRTWVQALPQLIVPEDYAGQLAVCLSFGTPLLAFFPAGEGGGVFNLINKRSGQGKTNAIRAAASIWGMWEGITINIDDTANSREFLLSQMCHLPVFHDELTNLVRRTGDFTPLRELFERLASGHGKKRVGEGGKALQPSQGHWQLALLSTSNNSAVGYLEFAIAGTDAMATRCNEFKYNMAREMDRLHVETTLGVLEANAGHAGDVFMAHLVQPEVLSYAKNAVHQWYKDIWRVAKLPTSERYRVRQITTALVAGDIARQLTLINYDIMAMKDWALTNLRPDQNLVSSTEAEMASDLLKRYGNSKLKNVVEIHRPFNPQSVPEMHDPLQGPPLIRYEKHSNRAFLEIKAFRRWIVEKGEDWRDVSKELRDKRILRGEHRVTLTAGTGLTGWGQVRCIEIDMNHPDMRPLMQAIDVSDEVSRDRRQGA